MANTYEKLRDFLEEEIDAIVKGGSLDKEKLHCLYEMVDVIKDIGEIDDHDTGVSQTGRMYIDPMMYGYSGANRNRDAMGRYSSRNGYSRGGSYNGGSSYRGGYSRGGNTMDNLQQMMDEAQTEQERDAIRRVMDMM